MRDAEHGRILDCRMRVQDIFDLDRRDVIATANDEFLRPPTDDEVAILVDKTQIARAGPAARKTASTNPPGSARIWGMAAGTTTPCSACWASLSSHN